MGKQIESPVKRWPGKVLLRYPTPLEPYEIWQACIEKIVGENATITNTDVAISPALLREMLPGICAMVDEWHIGGDFPKAVTPETYPLLPRLPSMKMTVWLISEINAIIAEEDDIPLA